MYFKPIIRAVHVKKKQVSGGVHPEACSEQILMGTTRTDLERKGTRVYEMFEKGNQLKTDFPAFANHVVW